MVAVIGWDIGGAHLKAARIEAGRVVAARQIPAPLWLGLDRLEAAIAEMRRDLGPARRHGVTMTGELADIFPNRATGVAQLSGLITATLAPARDRAAFRRSPPPDGRDRARAAPVSAARRRRAQPRSAPP